MLPRRRQRAGFAGRFESHLRVECDSRPVVVRHVQNEGTEPFRPCPVDHRSHQLLADAPIAEPGRHPHGEQEGTGGIRVVGGAPDTAHIFQVLHGNEGGECLELGPPVRFGAFDSFGECAAERVRGVPECREANALETRPFVGRQLLNGQMRSP